MPSNLTIPTVAELRQAFHDNVRGVKDIQADSHAGSVYDHFAGLGAIVWNREATTDRDQFESIYFDRATGQELTDYVLAHDNIERVEDSPGVGTISLKRATTSAGAGEFWKGTRARIIGKDKDNTYELSSDTACSSSHTEIILPIKATFNGRGSYINKAVNNDSVKIIDPLWDNTWKVTNIVCSEGTSFEQAAEFRARVRTERKKRRVGYEDIIMQKCIDNGAYNVFLLPSDFAGAANDFGINVCYVSDSGFATSDELRYKILVALEDVRVLGADLLVLPIAKSRLKFDLTITTWDDPSKLNSYEVLRFAKSFIVDYFSGNSGYSYDLNAIAGGIKSSLAEIIHNISFALPTTSQGILDSGVYRPILTKYEVLESDIIVRIVGP